MAHQMPTDAPSMNRAFIKGVCPEEAGFGVYTVALGSIVGNLLTLEFALRFFLHKALGEEQPVQLMSVRRKELLPSNHLTNDSSLQYLIREANRKLRQLNQPERIDPSLVDLRDSLAHGRVFSGVGPQGPYRLLRFSRPPRPSATRVLVRIGTYCLVKKVSPPLREDRDAVQVLVCDELTEEWFQSKVQQTAEAVNKIQKVLQSLYPDQASIVEAAD